MSKKFVIITACLVLAAAAFLAWLFFSQRETVLLAQNAANPIHAHAYNNPQTSLAKINLKIFYVVPANLQAAAQWQDQINSVLGDVVKFHAIQFHNSSQIIPDIYPEPVILENPDIFYDTNNTNDGNPQGLRNVVPELERRYPQFLQAQTGAYQSIAIIYEGVGASGAPNAMILSRDFLSNPEYSFVAGSLFYHEFAHTFGLPDRYNLTTNQPYSDDVMGSGRYKPLSTNYIGPDLLQALGVTSTNK